MKNKINYLSHVINDPPYLHRDYEKDLVKKNQDNDSLKHVKRVGEIALPFIALYQPLAKPLSFTMNSVRSILHFSDAIIAGENKKFQNCSFSLLQSILSLSALAGCFFNMTFGQIISTNIDIFLNMKHALEHLKKAEYEKSIKEFLQLTNNCVYLGIIFIGSLEVILASFLIQALTNLYEARSELHQKKYPETIAKVLMGFIRIYQTKSQLNLIQKRNFFFSLKKYERLIQQLTEGKKIKHLVNNEISDIEDIINKKTVILEDCNGGEYDFGAHLFGHGKGLVKGANITFREKVIDSENVIELDFKVNHVFRDRLKNLISEFKALKSNDVKQILSFTNSHGKDFQIEKVPSLKLEVKLEDKTVGEAYKISMRGLGSIFIGADSELINFYDRVTLRLEKSNNIYRVHELLSILNLQDALKTSFQEDLTRMKIGQLFRVFYPREATVFERTDKFFDLEVEDLKKEVLKIQPGMNNIFDQYLDKMELREILPGRLRFSIPGLAKLAKEHGAEKLTASITGVWEDDDYFERVASILKMGMLSPELRHNNDFSEHGLGKYDVYTGGFDSVYTQMLTDKECKENIHFSRACYYYNKIQLLLSLDLLETGTYQYLYDYFGTRIYDNERYDDDCLGWLGSYKNRLSVSEFLDEAKVENYGGNEVMIKERIAPSYIEGIVVQDQKTANKLLSFLKTRGLVSKNEDGIETILNIPVNKFLKIGSRLSKEFLN